MANSDIIAVNTSYIEFRIAVGMYVCIQVIALQ